MKKRFTLARLRYWFDCTLSKGPVAMTLLLLTATLLAMVVIGLLAFLFADGGTLPYQMWTSLMHMLDAGTLAGDEPVNLAYLLLMTVATLFGLFVTSLLIGVVATAVEDKLDSLRKGESVVQEDGHTVIIGYDANVFDLLGELLIAGENQKHKCIVVLGEAEKEEMEDAIAARFPRPGRTRIICRSGAPYDEFALQRCAVERCRSVIINIHEDAESIRALLAVTALLDAAAEVHPQLRIVMSIQQQQHVEAARIAGAGRADVIFARDAISRIIANTCHQHGLSQVLTELFNFSGNELYVEQIPQLAGQPFGEAVRAFANAIPVGLITPGGALLNPPMDRVIAPEDSLVLLEDDDGAYRLHPPRPIDESALAAPPEGECEPCRPLIILGSNDKLPIILREFGHYTAPGTPVTIIDDDLDESILPGDCGLVYRVCREEVTRELLMGCFREGTPNLLLLNDDSQEPEASDSRTLLALILLRDIASQAGLPMTITTEMRKAVNQRLAACAKVDDFVIGMNFISLLMAQISEEPRLITIIEELLDAEGSELYMKPASLYVRPGVPVDGYTLAGAAAGKGEVFVGYRLGSDASHRVIVNPDKAEKVTFAAGDQIVVIAQE